ncbi:ENSA protein, partial [Polyodon spathula]|nr:ENSA protein [Polyodon spathula]
MGRDRAVLRLSGTWFPRRGAREEEWRHGTGQPVEEEAKDNAVLFSQDSQEKDSNPVRAEEMKLKAKYPSLGQKPGGSDFLMKRLQKGQKYFDSGDYNMAKAKMNKKQLPSAGPDKNLVTGDHIPTPQDLPPRKSSLVTSKLAG